MTNDLVSIVVLNWNTLRTTQKCLKHVREYTDIAHEVIVVDNGSSDGSVDALRSESGVKLIASPRNLGYAGGNNLGVVQAQGEFLCLLNSDAFVTRGWLRKLLRCMLRAGADVVGPCTNSAKGRQRYGMRLRGLLPQPWRKTEFVDYLSFFCIVMRTQFYRDLGGLDERFGLGMFEDDDFCKRATTVGARLVIDGRTWVWHEGHATMSANSISHDDLFVASREIFDGKWGR
ncbi:glycosyltransferase family 2 protein [uncultured Thiodictyon sp.]|uniref:glycosyltransferase family 2 protein n=1 Tax=uncultured Thiodictyon sp. TaxID=1846217 RepID=UPI0025F1369F|nr:glycosyltransferase family 2 protein [uncultured Thiodictyon sp.]